MKIDIAKDYSLITGLRHCNTSDNSGEDFYHKILNKKFAEAYKNKEKLEVFLDGTLDGYSPSFLDEAFGNLVYDFGLDAVNHFLKIKTIRETHCLQLIEETKVQWEARRIKAESPQYTESHEAWFVVHNGDICKNNGVKV